MSAAEIIDQLRALTADERRMVFAKIWDEFADRDLPLTPAQATELDDRVAEHQERPNEVVNWNEIKAATHVKYPTPPS